MTEKQIIHLIIERAGLTVVSSIHEIMVAVHEARAGSWDAAYELHIASKIAHHLLKRVA